MVLTDRVENNVNYVLDCLEAHAPRVMLASDVIGSTSGGGVSSPALPAQQQPAAATVGSSPLLARQPPSSEAEQSSSRVQLEHKIDHRVYRLLEAAARPENLCQMKPTWMSWL